MNLTIFESKWLEAVHIQIVYTILFILFSGKLATENGKT